MKKRTSNWLFVAGLGTAAAGLATYLRVVRPWHLRWGTTDEEARRALPGDEFVPQPKLNATHAVTIHASRDQVWPWLVQIGQGRGGFYSYDWLEDAMGLGIHSADRVHPEFQQLKVGDSVPLAPNGFGVPVAILEPGRALVLHGDTRTDPSAIPGMRPGDYFHVSWGWFLEAPDDTTTRLIERWRADWNPGLQSELFMRAFLEPGAFVMERKMLLGVKERVEAASEGSTNERLEAPETRGVVIHWTPRHEILQSLVGLGVDGANSRMVVKMAHIRPGDKVLDVGCGTGDLTLTAQKYVGESGAACGIDAAPEGIEIARQKAKESGARTDFEVGLIEKIPYPAETFDVVISRLVIHHLPEDLKRQGFAEIFRVLKPGGLFLIADFNPPSNPVMRHIASAMVGSHMMQTHVWNLPALLTEAGFVEVASGPTRSAFLAFVRGKKPGL